MQKQQNTLKSSLLFKKNTNFTVNNLGEFLGLRMRNFQGNIFIWIKKFSEIFK